MNSDRVEGPALEEDSLMTMRKPEVFKRHGERRCGKGFTLEELKKAGTNFNVAMQLRIPIDRRRRTAHEENIEMIKVLLRHRKTGSKPRKTARKSKRQTPHN